MGLNRENYENKTYREGKLKIGKIVKIRRGIHFDLRKDLQQDPEVDIPQDRKIGEIPKIKILIRNMAEIIEIDTEAEVSVIQDRFYKELKGRGDKILELPVTGVETASTKKGNQTMSRQAILLIKIQCFPESIKIIF